MTASGFTPNQGSPSNTYSLTPANPRSTKDFGYQQAGGPARIGRRPDMEPLLPQSIGGDDEGNAIAALSRRGHAPEHTQEFNAGRSEGRSAEDAPAGDAEEGIEEAAEALL